MPRSVCTVFYIVLAYHFPPSLKLGFISLNGVWFKLVRLTRYSLTPWLLRVASRRVYFVALRQDAACGGEAHRPEVVWTSLEYGDKIPIKCLRIASTVVVNSGACTKKDYNKSEYYSLAFYYIPTHRDVWSWQFRPTNMPLAILTLAIHDSEARTKHEFPCYQGQNLLFLKSRLRIVHDYFNKQSIWTGLP